MKEGPSLACGGGPRPHRGRLACLLAPPLLALLLFVGGCSEPSSSTTSVSVEPTTTSTAPPTVPVSSPTGPSGGVRTEDVDGSLLVGDFVICGDCHALLDRSASANPGLVKAFAHGPHLAEGARCDDCHPVPSHTETEIRKPDMVKCFGCHSQTDPAKPSGACSYCHPPDFPLVPASHDDPAWLPTTEELVTTRATHPTAAQESPEECQVCHAPTFCQDCHQVDMPHPEDWQEGHADEAAEVGGQACLNCHPESESCSACHHPGYEPGGTPWWQMHPSVVAEQGETFCLNCHSTVTCAHCHTTGEYKVY